LSKKRKIPPQPASPVRPVVTPESPAIASPPPNSRTRLHLAILILLSLALFAPTLRNDFVTDDKLQILQNPLVLEGKDLSRAFTGEVWDFARQGKASPTTGSNYYRPLQLLAYAVEYQLFGDHPMGWHLISVLVNAAVVALVYLLVASLGTPTLAFWAAFWFAFHPMHTEPIAWIAALPELQCAFFLLLAMLCYHRARSASSPLLLLLLGALCFLAALFSKEAALLFPAILLCYEFFYARTSLAEVRAISLRLIPYFFAFAIYLCARISALHGFAPRANRDRAPLSIAELFFAVPPIFARYIGKLIAPVHMNYFYAFPITTTFTLRAAIGFLAAVLIARAVFYFRGTRPILSFALCWFVFTLAPALNLNKVALNFFTERYLYIPSVGFAILVASAGLALFSRFSAGPPRFTLSAAFIVLFAFYTVQTQRRVAVYHDNYSLLSATVLDSPDSYLVQGQLASAYYDRGDYDNALIHVRRALELDPDYVLGHLNAALYLVKKGDNDQAVSELQYAIRLYPDYLPSLVNLAKVYTLQHKWQLAADTYRHAATLDSGQSTLFLQLASLAEGNAKSEAGLASLQTIEPDNPQDFTGWIHLGDASSLKGQWTQAARAYEHAATLQPGNGTALEKWGVALLSSGDSARAVDILQNALQVQPGAMYTRHALASALASSNHLTESTAQFHKILQLNPTWEHADQVHLALGLNAEKSGDPATAIHEYQRALALNPSLTLARQHLLALSPAAPTPNP
jgi:protein O-mannosyl-transferase